MLPRKPRVPIRDILTFGILPSFLKVFLYRIKGYKIGKNVSIGFGSVICGKDVLIGDGVSLGFLSIIRGNKIQLDSHVSVGSTTFLDTPNITIGEGTRINEQVFVGGLQFPDSKFVVGRKCLIQQMSFINPSPSITIGDETAIGGHSLIFGHVSWQNFFEGYPVEFSPIEIGNHVGIGWRVFILPGSKIGDGTMIGANSVVNRKIPERCLAVGFPVRIVSKSPVFPKQLSENEKREMLEHVIEEMVVYFRNSDVSVTESGDQGFALQVKTKKFLHTKTESVAVKVCYENIPENGLSGVKPLDTVISLLAIPTEQRRELNGRNIQWIDIQNKERSDIVNDLGDEVVQYLERYGLRLYATNTKS